MSNSFPWKGSHRSIPPHIETALAGIETDFVIVAATKKIPVETIAKGLYQHLGLTYANSTLEITGDLPPFSLPVVIWKNPIFRLHTISL